MLSDEYVWLAWSSAMLAPWLAIFATRRDGRERMLWGSAIAAPLGLSELLWAPQYWRPPTVFDSLGRTGIDLESLIFSFASGGIAATIGDPFVRPLVDLPRDTVATSTAPRALRIAAIVLPVVAFPAILVVDGRVVVAAVLAMALGAALRIAVCPELVRKTIGGALAFTLLYLVFLAALLRLEPGYVERVWSTAALRLRLGPLPAPELAFAVSFGAYFSGLVEQVQAEIVASTNASLRLR